MNPKYPVYIVSKGRWKSRLTSKVLEKMKVPYKIVIEPQEFKKYSKVIDKEKILILPFKNLGQGSIPARNWIWEYSIKQGVKRHWILDDNIRYFLRIVKNKYYHVLNGVTFKIIEDWARKKGISGIKAARAAVMPSTNEINKTFFFDSRSKIDPLRSVNIYLSILWRACFRSARSEKYLPNAPDIPIAKHAPKPELMIVLG